MLTFEAVSEIREQFSSQAFDVAFQVYFAIQAHVPTLVVTLVSVLLNSEQFQLHLYVAGAHVNPVSQVQVVPLMLEFAGEIELTTLEQFRSQLRVSVFQINPTMQVQEVVLMDLGLAFVNREQLITQ